MTPPGPPLNPPPSGGGQMYASGGGDGKRNLLGWLSLIFGIIGTGCCCCWFLDGAPFIGGIPALILGILHLSRVRKGQASMGWLGWVGIILAIIALIGGITSLATDWNTRIEDQYNEYTDNN
ncbi:MAG TPA: hypothetical protein VF062_04680 [Candidatus Limnocylindrales bacterium]